MFPPSPSVGASALHTHQIVILLPVDFPEVEVLSGGSSRVKGLWTMHLPVAASLTLARGLLGLEEPDLHRGCIPSL